MRTVRYAAVMAPACDGAIMVITPGKITNTEALEVKKQLDKSACKILGAILNDIYGKRTNSVFRAVQGAKKLWLIT